LPPTATVIGPIVTRPTCDALTGKWCVTDALMAPFTKLTRDDGPR
jgi:hypothetical protein